MPEKSMYKRPQIKSFQVVIEKITVYSNFVLLLTYCMIDTLKILYYIIISYY